MHTIRTHTHTLQEILNRNLKSISIGMIFKIYESYKNGLHFRNPELHNTVNDYLRDT